MIKRRKFIKNLGLIVLGSCGCNNFSKRLEEKKELSVHSLNNESTTAYCSFRGKTKELELCDVGYESAEKRILEQIKESTRPNPLY